MGVAFLRKDGYVSLENDGAADTAVAETKPLRFAGKYLFVNADASGGSLEVELCNAAGSPLQGFERSRARPLVGDRTKHLVRWRATADLDSLAGAPVVVRFYLHKGAKLYSYRFGNLDPHDDTQTRQP